MEYGNIQWKVRAGAGHYARALWPLLMSATGACAAVLLVLLLFSAGESNREAMAVSTALTGLLLVITWAVLALGCAAYCLLRGRVALEYNLSAAAITLTERGRRAYTRTIALRDIRSVRKRRYGLLIGTDGEYMQVHCCSAARSSVLAALDRE